MNFCDYRVLFFINGKWAIMAAQDINYAFDDNTVNNRTIQKWFEKFKNDD